MTLGIGPHSSFFPLSVVCVLSVYCAAFMRNKLLHPAVRPQLTWAENLGDPPPFWGGGRVPI